MKIIICEETSAKFYEVDEEQAQAIKDFLTNDEFSIFRYGYSLGMRDERTRIIADLQREGK